jgi:uncharacterized Zn finger protein
MGSHDWQPYVSVAAKRRRAQSELAKLRKKGKSVAPVTIDGPKIAKTFWGKSWCDNLERYSDFAHRLPRGRSYVRNGAVLDLQVAKGKVMAMVAGSEVYSVKVDIAPLNAQRWSAVCKDCTGSVASLIELLQSRLDESVMRRVSREGDGLFPAPSEIKLSCSCPDWAEMCKHVAATLYGIGARLDEEPHLLFVLRGVNESDLVARASDGLSLPDARPAAAMLDGDIAALFGLEMADMPGASPPPADAADAKIARKQSRKTAKPGPTPKAVRQRPGAKQEAAPRAAPVARDREPRHRRSAR